MTAETITGWKVVMEYIDKAVISAERTARSMGRDPFYAARRDAWRHAQTAVARKLTKMMLTGEEETDAEPNP